MSITYKDEKVIPKEMTLKQLLDDYIDGDIKAVYIDRIIWQPDPQVTLQTQFR